MRLFLLPISTRRSLIYCDRTWPRKTAIAVNARPNLVDRLTNKVATTWAGWERQESGWKKSLTVYGNAALNRIPFEEWGLKTIPPLTRKRRAEILEKMEKVEVLFPGRFLKEAGIVDVVSKLATERQVLHRRRMIWSMIGAPLTLPFALVPVIPNIPGFYLLFRAWSHYRALFGSRHLEFLVKNKLIKPTPSPIMDELYTAGLLHPTMEEARQSPAPSESDGDTLSNSIEEQLRSGNKDVMLLRRWNATLLAESFELPEMEVEIQRAVDQVDSKLKEKQKQEKESDSGLSSETPEKKTAKVQQVEVVEEEEKKTSR